MVEWRKIPEYPDYAVSSEGQVMRVVKSARGKIGPIRLTTQRRGYKSFVLYGPSGQKTFRIHRVVCELFHGPAPSAKHMVAHNDGDPSNNRASNLRWATQFENEADKAAHGTKVSGEKTWCAKLSWERVRAMRMSYTGQRGEVTAIARSMGVSRTTALAVLSNNNWIDPDYQPHPVLAERSAAALKGCRG